MRSWLWCTCILLGVHISARQAQVAVVGDSGTLAYTLAAWESALSNRLDAFKFQISSFESLSQLKSFAQPVSIIVDRTTRVVDSYELRVFAAELSAVVLRPLHFSSKFEGDWVFYTHPPLVAEAEAMSELVHFLNWETFHLTASQDLTSAHLVSTFAHDRPKGYSTTFDVLSTLSDQEVFNNYAAVTIKASGQWKTVTFGVTQAVEQLVEGLETARIFKEGCALVAASRGAWSRYRLGTLVLVEEGLSSAESEADYEALAIASMLAGIDLAVLLVPHNLLTELTVRFPKHRPEPVFEVVNYAQDFEYSIIGRVEEGVLSMTQDIVYPGNVTTIPTTLPVIQISANSHTTEPNGDYNGYNAAIFRAFEPMVQIINDDPFKLPNFELRLHSTDCGAEYFDYDYGLECMQRHRADLGHFFVDSVWDETTIGNIEIFRELDIPIPHLSGMLNVAELYDKTVYPELLLSTVQNIYIGMTFPYLLTMNSWSNTLVFYEADSTEEAHEAFVGSATTLNIQIHTPVDDRRIPFGYTMDQFEEYRHVFEAAAATKVRVVVILAPPPTSFFIAQSVYEVGMRGGDLALITIGGAERFLDNDYGHDVDKVIEIFDGSLGLTLVSFSGDYGMELFETIQEMVYPDSLSLSCYLLDGMILGVDTIDLLLHIGGDYEDADVLNYFMRSIRTTGCSGTVSIDASSNGRSQVIYRILNFYTTGGDTIEPDVGRVTFGVTIPINLFEPFTFYGGTEEPPSDIRVDPECGFDEEDVVTNEASVTISLFVTASTVIIGAIISVLALSKKLRDTPEFLTEKQNLLFEDALLMILVPIEAVQIMIFAPSSQLLMTAYELTSYVFELDRLLDLETELFWRAYWFLLVLSILWTVCMILHLTRLAGKLGLTIKSWNSVVAIKLMPICSHGLFVVVISFLFKIYNCDQGTSQNIHDTVLENDCLTTCWQGDQLSFGIAAGIALLFYIPLSITTRTAFETLSNIASTPSAILSKSLLQLLLIELYYTIRDNSVAYSVAYFLICLVLALAFYKLEPTNYKRLNLWQRLAYVGVAWAGLWSLAAQFIQPELMPLVLVMELSAWLALGVLGIVLQRKFPSMLYRKPGRNIAKLFKFQLSNQIDAKELTEVELDYVYKIEENLNEEEQQMNEGKQEINEEQLNIEEEERQVIVL